MKHYLAQLISDMHLAAARVPVSLILSDEFDPDYMMELEESPEKPMCQWFGLEKEQFPPSERLTKEQLELMANEFEKLWAAFSFAPDFPDGLPAKRRYELLRDYLPNPRLASGPAGPFGCPFGDGAYIRSAGGSSDTNSKSPINTRTPL